VIAKVPYAAFAYTAQDATSPPDVGNELASMIEGLFLHRFGNAQSSTWARRVWLIETSLDSKRFGVSLKFLQARQEWRLIASTLDWPAKFSLLLSRWRIECNVEQKIICNEVHGLLSSNPQVSGLRWFYPGGRQAVVAPSDLWVQPLTTHSSGRSSATRLRAAKFKR
jgi:hypothetical protein